MKKFLIACAIAFFAIIAGIGILFRGFAKLDPEKITFGSASSIIYDRYGNEAACLSGNGARISLESDEIPEIVKNAFIAAEDKRFYDHCGIDLRRIFGAAISNLKASSLKEGGSTITQQLIKLTHLSTEKTFTRKLNEAWLAVLLETKMEKDEILTHYLNTVYFGRGAYGIESAARAFFSKNASELTVSEAALLAGIIKAPSAYSPDGNMEKALSRRDYVIREMVKEGFITEEEGGKAISEMPVITDGGNASAFGWYRDYVIEEAIAILDISADDFLTGGYCVYTCLDPERQARAEALFEEKALFPENAPDGTLSQAALVIMEPEGGILAMVGGREYTVQRGLNRAADARRQPGSTVKPISVYAAAIDAMGLSPTDFIDDTKRVFDGGYAPRNAGGSYNGLVTLREALSRSLNVASVSLMEFTGVNRARLYLERAGIPLIEGDSGLSLALGSITNGVTPLELTAAYAPLANGGMRVKAHAVHKITDRYGRTVYTQMQPVSRVMSAESAYLITDMLETAAKTGSARALSALGIPIAAKTGTVAVDENKNSDIWTVAYTENVIATCWMGFDQTTDTHSLRGSDTGSAYPLRLLAEFFKEEEAEPFQMPEGVVRVNIDKALLRTEKKAMLAPANAPSSACVEEVYLESRAPVAPSPAFSVPEIAQDARVYERNGKVIAEITIENDHYEYLLIRDTGEEKEVIRNVSGKKGEIVEIALEQTLSGYVLSILIRNRLMMENGVLLTSGESSGVWIHGRSDFLSKIERFFIME